MKKKPAPISKADIAKVMAKMNKPVMTKSAREEIAMTKAARKRQPKEDFNQAAFRVMQEVIKKSESE